MNIVPSHSRARSARSGGLRPSLRDAAIALLITFGVCTLATPMAQAVTGTLNGVSSDAQVNSASGTLSVSRVSSAYNYIGGTNGTKNCVVYVFQIPSGVLPDPSLQFTQATLTLKLGSTINAGTNVNGDLYGVGYSSSSTVVAADFYEGALDPNNMLILDNFVTPATPNYTSPSASNSALLDYLNACLANARADGAGTAYVFFRVNGDAYTYGNHYSIAMAEAGGTAVPKLDYTAEPVSNWSTVPLGGGGFVTGLVSDSTGNGVYCRTDVGGAFRWDGVNTQWISITDHLVSPDTPGASDITSIPSIAVDPNNGSQLYVAAGAYTYSPLHGIFSSSNGGASWTQINSTIVMDGNGAFRPFGERLCVDPNNSNIIWFGSTQGGLYKGVKSGSSWTWTQIPSTSVPFGQVPSGAKAGVTFVVCDKNGTSTIVYAGVYDSVGATGGVYRSTDAGSTWAKVGGAALGTPGRAGVAANGTVYFTSGTAGAGKILRGGTVTLLSALPTGKNYRGVAVARSDAAGNTFYIAEAGDELFRSVNGGSSFSAQGANFNSGNKARMEPDGTPTLTGYWWGNTSSLLVNPADANELWAADFFGVARTQNAQDMGTTNGPFWYMLQKNQEETVVETIKSPPTGARVVSGVADVGGFRYFDTGLRPTASNGGSLRNPSGGTTTSLDFSEADHDYWARAWVNPNHSAGSGGVSRDGGANWVIMGQLDSKVVTNSTTAGAETWDVTQYVAKQKAKGNNSINLAVCSGNSISPLYSNNAISFDARESAIAADRPRLIINGATAIEAQADAYVSDAATTTSYGTQPTLAVAYNFNNAPYSRRVYLRFNLSTFPGTITSAALSLHRRSSTSTMSTNVGVWVCANNTWVESSITWANKPVLPASGDVNNNPDPISNPKYFAGSVQLRGGRIAVSSTDPNVMVWLPEGTSNKAHYSNDCGASWTLASTSPTSQMVSQFEPSILYNQLASDRVNGKFYLAKFGGSAHTIYRSTDSGATWVSIGTVPANTYNVYRCQIVAAPAADDVWVCDDGVDDKTKGGLWRSTNAGASWTKLAGLSAVRQVTFGKAASWSGYTVFINGYKAGVMGIYRSDDYGANWTKLEDTPTCAAIESMAGDRQNYGKVWIGTHGRGLWEGH